MLRRAGGFVTGSAIAVTMLVLGGCAGVDQKSPSAPEMAYLTQSVEPYVPDPTEPSEDDGSVEELCTELPEDERGPEEFEGWWSSNLLLESGEGNILYPLEWPESQVLQHPRIALVEVDSGRVIAAYDRIACGQDKTYQPVLDDSWPEGSVVVVDMDTNELLEVL